MSEYICIKKEHLIYKYTLKNYNQLFKFTQEILDYLQKDDKKEKGGWTNATIIIYIESVIVS